MNTSLALLQLLAPLLNQVRQVQSRRPDQAYIAALTLGLRAQVSPYATVWGDSLDSWVTKNLDKPRCSHS